MDAHARYPQMLQPSGISPNNSELWSAVSQSFLLPSPSSSFNDLRELGVFDNLPSVSSASSDSNHSNMKPLELTPERGMKLDSLQRKLSLDFLNSNRRDIMHIEHDLPCRNDDQERHVMSKDTTSTILSLKKPILHNMSTARSMSPLPGVHTFRKKPEGIDNSRSPMSGEEASDIGHPSSSPGYEQGLFQAYSDRYSPNVYYPSHHPPHIFNNGSFTTQASKKPTYDVSPPVITVSRDIASCTPTTNINSYPDGSNSHNAFAVHRYPSSPLSSSADSVTSLYVDNRQLIGDEQNYEHQNKEQGVYRTVDHSFPEYDIRGGDISCGYYASDPSPTYEYMDRHFQESADCSSMNRPIVVNTSHGQSILTSAEQVKNAVTVRRNVNPNGRSTNQCHICRKTYGRPSTLKTHVRTHLGDRPYHFQLCGKSFTQPANLTAHIRIHSCEKPFSCPVCTRQFSQSSSLKTHMRTHSGERPYLCNICKKSFADSSTLTKHRRTHTGEKPYQCNVCLQQFSQSGNLKRHMKVHTDN